MQVNLIRYTDRPYDLVYFAGKACAYKDVAYEDVECVPIEEKEAFIQRLIRDGHESVLEHVTFTFHIHDISRVATHQLVRHRIASYSQYSHRRLDECPSFIIPDSVGALDEGKLKVVRDFLLTSVQVYSSLIQTGVPPEDARYFLPSGLTTSIVVTFNVRSLRNFLKLRLSRYAQGEIRELAKEMLRLVMAVAPAFFYDLKDGEPYES